jgi:hypothetical protein
VGVVVNRTSADHFSLHSFVLRQRVFALGAGGLSEAGRIRQSAQSHRWQGPCSFGRRGWPYASGLSACQQCSWKLGKKYAGSDKLIDATDTHDPHMRTNERRIDTLGARCCHG